MDMDFSDKLKGFNQVWRRVQQAKRSGSQSKAQPQPPRKKPQSRAKRFEPGGHF